MVILPPTITVWVVHARTAWLVKNPMAIAKATSKLIIFLGIYPPLAHLQDKSIEAHRVSLKPFNMLKMSFKTTFLRLQKTNNHRKYKNDHLSIK